MPASSHVLVIDDEPALRQIFGRVLDDAGYFVELASGAEEAFAMLSRGDIDVALCDIKMPDGNGIDVLRRARAAGLDTVFVMVTAIAAVETAVEALRAGAFDYMVKPVRNEELLQRLARIETVRGLREENQELRKAVSDKGVPLFRFQSPAMQDVDAPRRQGRADRQHGADPRRERHRQGRAWRNRSTRRARAAIDPSSR